MQKGQKIIELNGQKYDASTGKIIGPATSPPQKSATAPKPIRRPSNGLSVDGVAPARTPHHVQIKGPHSTGAKSSDIKKAIRPVAQPSATRTDTHASPVKAKHLLHAANVAQSSLISKFGSVGTHIKTDFVPVKAAPKTAPPSAAFGHAKASAHAAATPAASSQEILDKALAEATSHTAQKLKRKTSFARAAAALHIKTRTLAMVLVGFGLMTIGSFAAYQYVPHVALEVAAQRTGIRASLPSYSPSGFRLKQPISYGDDQIKLEYASNTDDRSFRVIQKASSWDSQALLDNFVTAAAKQYQTMQIKGRTIYTYNQGDAAWVDGGTLFTIEGKSSLSSDQLLKIIDSL